MGCSTIGVTKDAAQHSCGSKGTCSSGGCNKLNVYNWLSDMTLPGGQEAFNIVEVRFKGTHKEFFYNKDGISIGVGDVVAVEANPGHDIGVVSLAGELVRLQLKKKGIRENSDQIRALYRKAKQPEIDKWLEYGQKEKSIMMRTRDIIKMLGLAMKLSDVEYQGDGKKVTFFYTADDRVDFRELIKKLAEEFRVRIEMRQVGLRQEAARLGGIGSCGRELCCSTWLTDFRTVSTSAARYQNLALNPAKLAGQCSKLKCCLNYELDSYLDALKGLPDSNTVLVTEKGRAFHRKTDIFKQMMWFVYGAQQGSEAESEAGYGGNWIPLPVDRVKEIIEMNKRNEKPDDLKGIEEGGILIEALPDYENVVGQDRIDRMFEKKKKKHKKRKRPDDRNKSAQGGPNPQGGPSSEGGPQGESPRPQGGGVPRPQGQGPRPQGGGPRPQGGGPRPQGGGPRPQGGGPRPQGGGPRPQGGGPRPQGGGPRPQGGGPRPQGEGPKPTEGPTPQ